MPRTLGSAFRPSRRAAVRAVALLAVGVIALGGIARPSFALRHLKLVRSSPAADSMLASSPDAIRLWLSEPTEALVSKITLATEGGVAVALGAVTREKAREAPLVAKVISPLANGAYKVTWKTMSKDGHVVNGTFGFRVGAAK